MSDAEDDAPVVSFRISQQLLGELQELKPLLKRLPEYKSDGKLSRSALIRIAVAQGIERLREIAADRLAEQQQIDLLDTDQQIPDMSDPDN